MRKQIAVCMVAAAMLLTACGADAKEKKVADDAELVDVTSAEQQAEADEAVEETVEVGVSEEADEQTENEEEAEIKEEVTTKKPAQKKTVTKPAAQPSNPDAGCVDNSSDILTY